MKFALSSLALLASASALSAAPLVKDPVFNNAPLSVEMAWAIFGSCVLVLVALIALSAKGSK